MKRILVIFLAAAAAAQAQGGAVSPPSQLPQGRTGMPASMAVQPAPMAHPEAVGANEPVITVHGFCPEDSRPAAACSTVITKAQFEKIMAAVNQSGAPMPAVAVRNLAERYVQMLAFARAAEKLGLDKDPKFQELMRFVRLNNLTEAYRRAVNDQNKLPSDADVQAYYASNIAKFEQVRLSRIFVPRVNPKAPRAGLDDFEKRALKVAADLRERAARGENLDKLQQEAYKTLDLTPPSLNTDVGTRRRGSFPRAVEDDIFALKSGEVTRVESEPAGFQFYKLQGRDTLTLAQVKNEIVAALHKEQLEASNKSVLDPLHTDLNETYFGPRSTGAPLLAPASRPPQPQPRPGVSSPGTASPSGAQLPSSPK